MSSFAPPPAFVCRDESPPLQGNQHYVRAFTELSRRLGVPIDRYPAKMGGSESGFNLEPASEPLFEIRYVKPLTRVLPMNGYPEMVFNATELEFHKRDDEQERDKPLELRPLPEPRDEDIDDDDSRLLSYMSEQGLVDSIMYLLNLRAGKVMSAAIGEQAFFVRPTENLSATDIAAALVSLQPPRMPIKVELCTVLTDDDFMTIIAEMKSSDGEIEFQWPQVPTDAEKPELASDNWGAFRNGEKMRGNWSHKYDTILFQLYAQIIAAKDVSGGLDALQLDRTCGLLTNGRKWIIMGEKDGVAYIAPYVLDGNEHAVAAVVVALFLGAMTPSRQGEHADEPGGDEPLAKKRKGAKRVIRSLLDDVVPRAAATSLFSCTESAVLRTPLSHPPSPPPVAVEALRVAQVVRLRVQTLRDRTQYDDDSWIRASPSQPSSRLLSGSEADPLSAFTVEDPPKLTFRLWSKFRPSVVFIYRSTDKQYALKHVECVKMSSRVGELDGYAATDEILCEAKALEHLEARAPALSGFLFPPYLGLWTSAGDRTLFGLITTWFGEPVEPCSLEYLHSLDPMGALNQLHSLGVAHGDIHGANLRLVSSPRSPTIPSPPSIARAAELLPLSRQDKIAFLDFGRSRLEKDLTPSQWESAKAEDRHALKTTLTP